MNCAQCSKPIESSSYISFASRVFCSDVCQLRFHKDELPNLGGEAITDEDIKRLAEASGRERDELRQELFLKASKALEEGGIMQKIHKAADNSN